MIVFVSLTLAAWEAFAMATKRPTITDLSHTRSAGPLVWGWLCALAVHFWMERNGD